MPGTDESGSGKAEVTETFGRGFGRATKHGRRASSC